MQTLKMALCFVLAATFFVGCALFHTKPKDGETTVRLYEQADSALPAENQRTIEVPDTDLKLTINPFPTLTEQNIQSAEVYNTAGGKAIFLRFDAHGTVLLDEMTTRMRGQYVAVLVNNRPVSAWLVNQRILNGQFLVEGDLTDDEATNIVFKLNEASKKNK